MRAPLLVLPALLLTAALPARAATADTLLLKDGRTVEAPKAEKQPDGSWVLRFQSGDVPLPAALVQDAWLIGAQGYEPRNEDEKLKLEKGLVPHEGKWIPKGERDAKVAKKTAEAKKRIEEAKAHREWRNRYKTKSSNFEVEYTIPPEIAKGYIDKLEAFYSHFVKEFKVTKPKERLKVCFYHDYETFLQVSGAPYGAAAYYRFVAPLELNLFYDRLRPEETVAILYHEAQHYMAHLMNLKFHMPHQMGEGASEYYGGCRWDAAKKQMLMGGVQEGRLTEVQTDIAKGTRPTLQDYLEGKLGYDDYTWGWTFQHFMHETPKYAKKWKAFYTALPDGKDIPQSPFRGGEMVTVEAENLVRGFKKYLGVDDLKVLEKEWHDYVDKNLKVTSVTGYEDAAFAASRTGRMIRAKRLFGEAVAKGSTNPTVYLRYGDLLTGEDNAKAEALFRQGLGYDPLNANLWTELGRLVRHKGGPENEAAGKKLIQLAAEIDPDSVDTWLLMEEAMEKTGPPVPKKGGDEGGAGGN